jgi:hypothetical protein
MPFLQLQFQRNWDCKNGIVFAYRQDLRPAAASGKFSEGAPIRAKLK